MKKNSLLIGVIILAIGLVILLKIDGRFTGFQGKMTVKKNLSGAVISCSAEKINNLLDIKLSKEQLQKNFTTIKADCEEKIKEVTGRLETFITHTEKGTELESFIRTASGEEIMLMSLANSPMPATQSGLSISISGILSNNNLFFDQNKKLTNVILEPATGPKKMLILLVYFKGQIMPDTDTAILDWQEKMSKMDSFFRENSYEKVSLVAVQDENQSADVRGWYEIPIPTNCVGGLNNLLAFSQFPDVDFSQYDGLVIAGDFNNYKTGSNCKWGGKSSLGKIPTPTPQGMVNMSVSLIDDSKVTDEVLEHELGHGFGLLHSNLLDCVNTYFPSSQQSLFAECNLIHYGDKYSTMGLATFTKDLNVIHKEQLKWIPATAGKLIEGKGDYNLALEPVETVSDGLKMIKIPYDDESFLFLEYRQPIGFDYYNDKKITVFDGILIYTDAFMKQNILYGGNTVQIVANPDKNNMFKYKLAPLSIGKPFTARVRDGLLTVSITDNQRNYENPELSRMAVEIKIE